MLLFLCVKHSAILFTPTYEALCFKTLSYLAEPLTPTVKQLFLATSHVLHIVRIKRLHRPGVRIKHKPEQFQTANLNQKLKKITRDTQTYTSDKGLSKEYLHQLQCRKHSSTIYLRPLR